MHNVQTKACNGLHDVQSHWVSAAIKRPKTKTKMKITIGNESSSNLNAHSVGSADGEIWLLGPQTNSYGHKEWGVNVGRYGCAYCDSKFYTRKEAVAEVRKMRRTRSENAKLQNS